MRDKARIRVFCDKLADIWESKCPDWRFGQMMMNVLPRKETRFSQKMMK